MEYLVSYSVQLNPSYHTMIETTVRCSSEVNRFGLETSYGMYVIVTATPYQHKGEAAYSIPLGTRSYACNPHNSAVTLH